jgi:hypothetical protein
MRSALVFAPRPGMGQRGTHEDYMTKAVVTLSVLSLALSGCCFVRGYVNASKKAEGKNNVGVISLGAIACAEASGGKLPASTPLVPANLAQVSGKKYMSQPSDWDSPSFKCMKFALSEPQYFQVQWVLKSPTSGTARAVADLDGDGTPDSVIEKDVTCTGGACTASPTLRETE